MTDVEVNIDWTLDSIKETMENDEHTTALCFGCERDGVPIKVYTIAVKSSVLYWQDGMGPVWEKVQTQYCDDCAVELMSTLQSAEL